MSYLCRQFLGNQGSKGTTCEMGGPVCRAALPQKRKKKEKGKKKAKSSKVQCP